MQGPRPGEEASGSPAFHAGQGLLAWPGRPELRGGAGQGGAGIYVPCLPPGQTSPRSFRQVSAQRRWATTGHHTQVMLKQSHVKCSFLWGHPVCCSPASLGQVYCCVDAPAPGVDPASVLRAHRGLRMPWAL